MYTALDQNLFGKYGISAKHVVIRTGTNINLAALATDEIQFLDRAGECTPGMAAGSDATLVASPLIGLPYVIIARKEINTISDLKGKSIGVGSVGGLPYGFCEPLLINSTCKTHRFAPWREANPTVQRHSPGRHRF